jgi:methylenetetrahydrofolate reductase (NADPH)
VRISDQFGQGRPVLSFEFFPPKTDKGYDSLYRTIAALRPLQPSYVSVTWGAGGTTRRKTVELVTQIQNELGITAMAHMTTVGSDRGEIAETFDRLQSGGIQNLLALSGDPPEGYVPVPDGFRYASELAEFARSRWDFCLAAGCYPEIHPRSANLEEDMRYLVQKVEAGVDLLITQLFFDNRHYFDFVARARAAGIELPIVPGIMPIVSQTNVRRIASLSGATMPSELERELESCGEDDEQTRELGIRWAIRQCRELLDRGAPGIHFYTLNRSPATRRIYESIFG